MDQNIILLLASLAGVVLVWVTLKLVKNVLLAVVIGAAAGSVLWWTLPKISERDDLVGETARRAEELGEQAGEAAEEISDGARRAAQAAQDLAEEARNLRDKLATPRRPDTKQVDPTPSDEHR